MARGGNLKGNSPLIRQILELLTEEGAALRPALDERNMVISVRRAGISMPKRTVTRRDAEKLLASGFIRREAPPARSLVITFKGQQTVHGLNGQAMREADLETVIDSLTGDKRLINMKESPLIWLARRKNAEGKPLIDSLQLAAGERLRSDFTLAGLTPRMTLDWARYGAGTSSGIGHPGLASDVMMAARQRVHAALDVLGPELAGLALDLCCFLKGIGEVERMRGLKQRSAKHSLIKALDRLIAHYGMGAVGPERGQGIRVWAEP